ncbi:MAG: N-acetylneuraminate synthase [Candidatus Rifleibacterium amylolyticum]|nr:MAG: N-acetylneuraminate synthase [Candidatus Rifleibacterium amylolyticum]
MDEVKLGKYVVGKNHSPYVIAEIGANHNGDMAIARQLIDVAKECGCNAVKFQSWTPESLISQEEYDNNQVYTDSPKKHFGSLREMVKAYYLRKEQHFELKKYCLKVGLDFCSTPFSYQEVDLLEELGVPFYKIASMDINNFDLLAYVSSKGKPVLLSTGMADLAEIERAVHVIEREGNRQIILLHCISIYPPDFKDINLNNIPMLSKAFDYPVGFSDHSIGISIPLAAVALGSCIIEKHFTLDKDMPGWDHEISADPHEMKALVCESRNVFTALGSSRRIVSEAELEKRKKFRRSIIVNADLPAGHVLRGSDLEYKRPGTFIPPSDKGLVIGRVLKNNLTAGKILRMEDLL